MNKAICITGLLGLLFLATGCSDDVESVSSSKSGGWLVPVDEVFDGGPGKDGIPALTNPAFVASSQISYMQPTDLIIGVRVGETIRGYPHPILDWHEIINDDPGGRALAITYCPLTGSAIGWDRKVNGAVSTFGVSGLLYNTNLMPYDRATNSTWSQMKLQCVNGTLIGQTPQIYPVIETTWETWLSMYPDAPVVSANTGFNRSYGIYPYRDYRSNNGFLLFPISMDDMRLSRKERILGVRTGNMTIAYRIGGFVDSVQILNETAESVDYVVAGSAVHNFAVAFNRRTDDTTLLTFGPKTGALPVIMVDNEGTEWDIFGRGVAGPRAGQQLAPADSYIAFWFAWAVFNPGVEIYGM